MSSFEKEPIPLRPHHGMCLAYYEGKGYSEGFTAHMGKMLTLLERNPRIRLTQESDCICSACPNRKGTGCLSAEKVQNYDSEVLRHCGREDGDVLNFMEFAQSVQEHILEQDKRREICGDCQWDELCSRKKSRWIR